MACYKEKKKPLEPFPPGKFFHALFKILAMY